MARFLSLSVILSLALLSGCADVITYSRDAQMEGMKLYREGNYADAAGAFRNSVRQSPGNYESSYYLGECYAKLKQYEQSIAAYRTARATINLTLDGRYDEAMHQKILNGLADAIAASDHADIELNSVQKDAQDKGTAENWLLLAKIYARRGDVDSAMDAYNRAALLEPTNFAVLKDYGLYLERVGQTQKSEAPLKRAYSLNNDDADVTAALRRLGIVPGPTLGSDGGSTASSNDNSAPIPTRPPASPRVEAPRD